MATWQARFSRQYSATKQKAVEEAQTVQKLVARECKEAGKEPPPYSLLELIGRGSFGRVYKATSIKSRQAVAVKIISIDEGDSICPGAADTFSDVRKEVNTLKLLSDSGAKNVNSVIDTLLVGHSIWIITEHCAGGSVATLMRPTGGLAEKWIIPVLREVAEAIYWVHKQGIIHRDIKCANVLITEAGGVQLCDFGVAGIVETRFDKRSTVTGTLQWMAPELFDSTVSYGSEVDIWAFGSMAYEMATGLPPNAGSIVDLSNFGSYLKQHCPRLTDDRYSSELKDLVAFCLVEDPVQRPPIEQVQQHPYIHNTSDEYPTVSLSKLVSAYRVWEIQGGVRRSLFAGGGAQGPPSNDPTPLAQDDEWNFSATDEEMDLDMSDAQVLYDVYGSDIDLDLPSPKAAHQPRRRRPPHNIKALKVPLEKVFDPNTITNYGENARIFYGKAPQEPASDLPLRDNSEQPAVRESLIDLDLSLDGGDLSQFADLDTVKAGVKPVISNLDGLGCRRTQDWTFPLTVPAPADLDMRPVGLDNNQEPVGYVTDTPYIHVQHDQNNDQSLGYTVPTDKQSRLSVVSLIDLDEGLSNDMTDTTRPSTAGSDAPSTSSDQGRAPFELDRNPFDLGFAPRPREPSIYVSDDTYPTVLTTIHDNNSPTQNKEPDSTQNQNQLSIPISAPLPLPLPPSAYVMQGHASPEDTKKELGRMVTSLRDHLQLTSHVLENLPVRASKTTAH